MRTVKFKTVYHRALRLMSKDPATAVLDAMQKERIAGWINAAVMQGWRFAPWKDTETIEQRAFRAAWIPTTTYTAGEEVYVASADKYYLSLQNANLGMDPTTETSWWEETTATLEYYLPWAPADSFQFGEVLQITKQHPYGVPDQVYSYNFRIANDQVWIVDKQIPTKVYVRYRNVSPEFTLVEKVPAQAYSLYDLVYVDAEGECFQAVLPEGTWQKVGFPKFLENFVAWMVASHDAKEQGDDKRSDLMESQAMQFLQNEYEYQFFQQGQYGSQK